MLQILALLFGLLIWQVKSVPITVRPGTGPQDIWVRDCNTLNATAWANGASPVEGHSTHQNLTTNPGPVARLRPVSTAFNYSRASSSTAEVFATSTPSSGFLSIDIINKLPSKKVHIYVFGLDPDGRLVALRQDGTYAYLDTSATTPTTITENIAIPLGKLNSTRSISLPGYLDSARVWIADGTLKFYIVNRADGTPGLVEPAVANANDPNADVNYAFAELTWNSASGLWADITAVDFLGLPLGLQVKDTSGSEELVLGAPADAAPRLCRMLKAQAKKDHLPWDQLCVYNANGELLRVLAPSNLISQNSSAFQTYFSHYVNRVWTYYAKHDLVIDTQAAPGNVTCRVSGDQLQCAGDNRGYSKPTASDIFGCGGAPFSVIAGDNAVHMAVVPRLCAAFNRATLFLTGGNVQPSLPPKYYYSNPSSGPKNWYSKFVHAIEVAGKGYAFPYDDVAPAIGADQSGLVHGTAPELLTIIAGGA